MNLSSILICFILGMILGIMGHTPMTKEFWMIMIPVSLLTGASSVNWRK